MALFSSSCCSKLTLLSSFFINRTPKKPYTFDFPLSSRSNFPNLSLISLSASPLSRGLSSRSPAIAMADAASSSSYEKELAAAKKAASLAARLCQTVQKAILQSDVQSKSDKSPVTVADYGYFLNPHYQYHRSVRNDDEVTNGFRHVVDRLVSDATTRIAIKKEAEKWRLKIGIFGHNASKNAVKNCQPGSQALVSLVLRMELPSHSFSMVAEEDSGDLRKDGAQETLKRITKLVNDTISADGTYNISLSEDDVLVAIDSGKSEGGPHGRHWVLDPIDGTKGFLRGDQYAIALALLDKGRVVLGVLACPNLPLTPNGDSNKNSLENKVGSLFSAKIGAGTHVQSLEGSPPTKVHVSNVENPADASFFESFEAAHSLHDLSSSIAKKLGVQAPPVRIDSQAKYGALSRGDGAIYLRFPHQGYREKIWDHAAGCIVVTEAGGVASDAAGNDLDFSKGRYLDLDTGIIVTNKKLMPLLLNAVQASLKEKLQSASPL